MCMEKKIRCAVIGVGRLGYWHATNISTQIRNVELVAICDSNRAQAENVANGLCVPQFTDDANVIMEDASIDAIIIATSTSSHHELLVKAAKNNKHVFVEKPITLDLEHAYHVRDIFKEKDTICQVGFMRRFDPAYDRAKKRILAGDIGEPLYFKGISRDPVAPHVDFIGKSGGIFIDVSIHDFDIARYLMNSDITAVLSVGQIVKYPFLKEHQDVDQGLSYIEFESGAIGDIEASRNAYYGYDIRAEVIGSEGSLFIGDLKHHDIYILNKTGKSHDIIPDFPERFAEAYYLEMKDFFTAIQENRVPRVAVDDGVKALEVGVAARESSKTQKKIYLQESKKIVMGE